MIITITSTLLYLVTIIYPKFAMSISIYLENVRDVDSE